MTSDEFENVYWEYYLVLERDVMNVEPYVAFHPDNFNCFSNEFIKTFLSICSEIDVVCKKYCKYIKETTSTRGNYKKIKEYAQYILTHHSEISEQEVRLTKGIDYSFIPWKEWIIEKGDDGTPKWWRRHNAIKHQRSKKDSSGKYHYQYANLDNVLNALAALYIIEKYFYRDLVKKETLPGNTPVVVLTPYSKLFRFFSFEETYLSLACIGL